MKKAATKSRPMAGFLTMIGVGIFALVAVLVITTATAPKESEASRRRKAEESANAYNATAKVWEAGGCQVQRKDGRMEITVPLDKAQIITPFEAKEMALTTKQKAGVNVVILSPAGQILASSD